MTAKEAAEKIMHEFGVYTEEDWYNIDGEEGMELYEEMKAGVLEEYDLTDSDMEDLLDEIFNG